MTQIDMVQHYRNLRGIAADFQNAAFALVQHSTLLEFGRRLAYYHRYQKLALDDELKQMEDEMKRGDLIELQAVKPVLQEIYDDGSVLNVVRARAQRLMEVGNGAGPGR